jgi:hypothetical protein
MILAFHIARVVALILAPVVVPAAMLRWAALCDRKRGAAQS